ncbi:MAG TPA: hypothetical protein VD908_00665 [Cytophagales bacterium]|nr:hypothetical protein [Cytophagales bacterium]
MKKISVNYLLVLFCLAGIGMLSSCNPEDIVKLGPTIELVNPPAEEQEAGAEIDFTVEVSASENIKSITIIEKIGSSSTTVDGYPIESGFNSKTGHLFVFDYTVPNAESVELTFKVTDKNGKEASESHTITIAASDTELAAAAAFEWKRVGSAAGTGLEAFGLAWTSNTTTSAVIKKGADKLVVLAAADWTSITTKEALKAKVDAAADVTDYRGVSAEASGSYNDVIATKKGDVYYLINITKATVTTPSAGTTIVITGNSKN